MGDSKRSKIPDKPSCISFVLILDKILYENKRSGIDDSAFVNKKSATVGGNLISAYFGN